MKIRIWGAQGSLPSPLTPDAVKEKIIQAILAMPNLDTNNPDEVRAFVEELPPLLRGTAKGNTSCVEVRAGGEIFIIDAGSGIRELGLELLKGPCGRGQGKLHILFSHPHWDHIQGFPFFIPAYIPGNQITFYSVHNLEYALTEQQRYFFFPVAIDAAQAEQELAQMEASLRQRYGFIPAMQAHREFVRLEAGASFSIGSVRINTSRNHHPGDAYSYRFEDQHSVFVYGGDAEYKDLDANTFQEQVKFFKDADAVIFDAQYGLRDSFESKADYGHSSAMIGVDFARRAGVKKLLLTHHEPTYSDEQLQEIQETATSYQDQDHSLPTCEVIVAYEGLEIDLAPVGAIEVHLLPDEEAAVLSPGSVFDEQGVAQLVAQLADLTKSDRMLGSIVDLSQVERLTTASLKTLVTFSRQREERSVVLAAPSAKVEEVIKLGGYGDYFAVYPTVDEAVKAVQAREALNLPGQTINNRYQITETLGQSTVGTVLKVIDQTEQRPAALRVLSPAFGVETIDRFVGQAHHLLGLEHDHIAQVYDCDWGQEGNHIFIVEELLAGPTLFERLTDNAKPLATDEALDMALDLTLALEYAHSHGVIHGNLKPQDIFLTETGVKISGFNLSRLEERRNLLDTPVLYVRATHLAPEQILGQPLDARTDLYALGVILYQLFTGRLPFAGTDHEVMQAHLGQAPTPPRAHNPALSHSVEHLILKLLAKNPNERYASAQQAYQISSSLMFSTSETGQPIRQNLVGRSVQLQTLRERWLEAEAGRGQLVFITGEPGVGKTSLARQMAFQNEAPVVLLGHCQEKTGRPAYQPFSEALQAYFATVPPEISDLEIRRWLSHFSQLVPKLKQIVPDLPEVPELDPQQEQLRLISSLTQFVKWATQSRPWLLILDDLQWIDEASVELLRYLGRHLGEMAFLIVGTYRDMEVGSDHPLQRALRDLGQSPNYRQLPLDRLNQADVAQALANLWDPGVPEVLTETIYRHTEGNPLYVEEVAKGLQDDGLVTMQAGQWHFPKVESIRLPQSVYDAVERRIHYLNAETRDVLSLAAVLGKTFRFDDVVAMSGLSEWTVLDHLDLALERQLMQELHGGETLRFSHAEIHHIIYNDLGALRRRRLHLRAGKTIEERAQPEPEELADELAYHFSAAGELERAVVYSIPAARQAQQAYANEAALQWYERTLEMLDQLGSAAVTPSFQSMRLSVYRSMGEVLQLIGRWDKADEMYQQALDLAEAIGDRSSRAWCQTARGHLHCYQGDYAKALEWLERARGAFEDLDDQPGIAQVYHTEGLVAWQQGDHEKARAVWETSLDIRRKLDDQPLIARLLNNLGLVAHEEGDYETGTQLYQESLEIRYRLGDKQAIAQTLNNLGYMAVQQGDYEAAQAQLEFALTLQREVGDQWGIATTLHNLANAARGQENYDEARGRYEESLTIARELGDGRTIAYLLGDMGGLAALEGQAQRALQLVGAAEGLREDIGAPIPPADQAILDRLLEPARLALGAAVTASAMAEGRAMSLEEAIEYALQIMPH